MEMMQARRTRSSLHEEAKDDDALVEMNIPGLCNGEEDDEHLDSSQYRAAVDALSRQDLRTELLKQVREQPWFSQRSLAYQNHKPTTSRRGSMNEESFSYAKALVESDAELERISQEISTQLHLTEMMEVAARAQKAADEGCETFSARLSSFVPEPVSLETRDAEGQSDAEPVEHKNGPLVTTPAGRESNPTSPPFRHIAEVIPSFETVNNHMRTHLYRKKVAKETLVFKEVEDGAKSEQNFNLSPRSQGTEITADFFKNLSGYFGKRVRSEDEDEKDASAAKETGLAEYSNGTLEDHIPLDMLTSSIPAVGSLASLNSLTLKPFSTIPTIAKEEDGAASCSAPPTQSTSKGQADDSKNAVKETLEILNSVSDSTGPTETDQGSDNDGSSFSCPSSPSQGFGDLAPLPLEITEAVQMQQGETSPKQHDFNTPKRLRILRQADGGEPTVATPDHSRYNFSPGSIVASSVGAPSAVLDPLEEYENTFLNEQTRLLEIPRIGEKPQQTGDLTTSPAIHDAVEKAKRTRRIRMLRRRLDDEDNFSSETREGGGVGTDEETKSGHYHLDSFPMNGHQNNGIATQGSNLSPRPQPDEALEERPLEEPILGTTSLCSPTQPSLMETASVVGIPLIAPSPSCCADDKQYFKEKKNDEYMNNYFYLSRRGGSERRDLQGRNYRRFICAETIDKTGILCQDVGATCNDLDHLFLGSNEEGTEKVASSTQSASSQASGWFSQIGLGFLYGSTEKKRIGDATSRE
ncbi:unnamed protein product [Cylindrotheca closterium]|uniref:Uncharacterized protein n=1 Tax=Cylindrotheca closterium TaxID=2856 RepID=A0AAD2CFD2_9STRA|nr:unnamed protein product [Cylindrotheca closterium]